MISNKDSNKILLKVGGPEFNFKENPSLIVTIISIVTVILTSIIYFKIVYNPPLSYYFFLILFTSLFLSIFYFRPKLLVHPDRLFYHKSLEIAKFSTIDYYVYNENKIYIKFKKSFGSQEEMEINDISQEHLNKLDEIFQDKEIPKK